MSDLEPAIVKLDPQEAIAVRGDVVIADLPDFFERAFATVAAAVEASVGAFFTRVVSMMPGLTTVELAGQTRWPNKVEPPTNRSGRPIEISI